MPFLDIPDSGPVDLGPASDAVIPVFGLTGDPCVADEDCDTVMCLTTELIQGMGVANVVIPNGMCSMLFCYDDEQCGDGARCMDFNVEGTEIALCLKVCTDSMDCRYSNGYACFDTAAAFGGETAEEGAETEEPALPTTACLPASLVQAVFCGDGICDSNEKSDVEMCPLDCSYCGDGYCFLESPIPAQMPAETAESCPEDCAE